MKLHKVSTDLSSRWVGDFLIESGIPIPESQARTGLSAALRALKVGDSLVVKDKKASSVHAYAVRVGIRIKTKTEEDGTARIWRIE